MGFAEKSFSLFRRDVILFCTNLCTSVVVARKLGPEMMGLWTILLLIPSYAEAFGRLKFDIAAVYFLGKKKVPLGEMTFFLHIIAIVTSLVITIIFIANFSWFYQLLFKKSTINMQELTFGVLLVIPLRMLFSNYVYLLIFKEDIKTYNLMIIWQAFTNSIVSIVLILVFNLGIFGALMGNILGLLSSILYAGIKLNGEEKIKPKFDVFLLINMAKYSFHQYVSGIMNYIQISLTDLLIAMYLLPSNAAFYTLSKSISDVSTRLFTSALNTMLFSRVSKSDKNSESEILTAHAFKILFIILTGIFFGLYIIIKPLIFVLYGEKYFPMVAIFRIIFPGFVLNCCCTMFTSYFSGIGRVKLLTKMSILPVFFQIICAINLLPRYGLHGGAWSFLLSSLVNFMMFILVFINTTSLTVKDIIPKRSDLIAIYEFVKKDVVAHHFNLLLRKM